MAESEDTDGIDRTAFSVTSLSEQSGTRAYWQSRSPENRLAAVEQLRRLHYDDDPSDRFQRRLELIRRA